VTSLLNESQSDPLFANRDKLNVYINKIDEYYDLTISKHDRDFINAYMVRCRQSWSLVDDEQIQEAAYELEAAGWRRRRGFA